MRLGSAALTLLIAVVASAALALGIQSTRASDSATTEADPELGVEWAYRPDGLSDLVDHSSAIVMAEVEAIRPGAPWVLDPSSSPSPEIPTSLVDVRVTESIDGETPPELTIHQVGGAGLFAEGDPAYAVGERYLLFVRPREGGHEPAAGEGTWLTVAPDGRLGKEGGVLQPEIAGEVADRLEGDTVPEAQAEIAAANAAGTSEGVE
jgi:hypothetical protein